MTLLQQQQQDHTRADHCADQENEGKALEDNKHHQNGHGPITSRQFVDLELVGGAAAETDEASLSSSEGRIGRGRSRSPMNNIEASTGGSIGRGDSPGKSSQGWGPNKVPRLNHASKNADQATEATMRKARVSVRARSEAPMVQIWVEFVDFSSVFVIRLPWI